MFDSSQHMCVQWEVCVKIPFQQAYVMSKNSFDSTLWTSLHTDRQHVETWVHVLRWKGWAALELHNPSRVAAETQAACEV